MLDVLSVLRRKMERIRLFWAEEEVFYIGGSDVLPPPLERELENQCLTALVQPDLPEQDFTKEDARRMLIEHNLRLVVYLAKKFENTGIGLEDLISIGTIGLIKAANTFRPDKNIKLATYASRCIENEILMYIRKSGNIKTELSFDEPLSTDWDGNELLLSDVLGDDEGVGKKLEDEEDKKIIAEAISGLSEREREIIELRFGLGGRKEKTQKEVADMLGISQSYISRLEKKIIDRLRSEIQGKI